MSSEDCQNVKNFYTLLKLSNLGELNKLYNFQDTIILCEIFEQRSDLLKQIFKYNPRKCNSASSFSGCVHHKKSKCCITLPPNADFIRVFEKTLIGSFSCVNTRLAFDTDILANDPKTEKVLTDVTINGKKNQLKRFSSKILKMDENNQYGQVMTKPLSYGCIKKQQKKKTRHWRSLILNSIEHADVFGHIFTVDIKFYNINEKTLLFNKIYPPIF